MAIIVLDSNIIIGKENDNGFGFKKIKDTYYFKSTNFKELKSQIEFYAGNIKVVIPYIVNLEVIKNFKADVSSIIKKLTNQEDLYKELTKNFANIEIKSTSIEQINNLNKVLIGELQQKANNYPAFLQSEIENEFNGEILNVEELPHEYISDKAINRKQPFKKDGSGYQDALIWEYIIYLLENNPDEQIFFISNNTKDFGENDTLSVNLNEELKVRSTNEYKNLKYLNSLDKLKKEFEKIDKAGIIKIFQDINELKPELESYLNTNKTEIIAYMEDYLLEGWYRPYSVKIEQENFTLEIINIRSESLDENSEENNFDIVYKIYKDNKAFFDFDIECGLDLTLLINLPKLEELCNEAEYEKPQTIININAKISIEYDINSKKFISFEVNDIEWGNVSDKKNIDLTVDITKETLDDKLYDVRVYLAKELSISATDNEQRYMEFIDLVDL